LFYADVRAVNARYPDENLTPRYYAPKLGYWVSTRHPDAQYVQITGPGLKSHVPDALAGLGLTGVVAQRSAGAYRLATGDGQFTGTWLPGCDDPGRTELACMYRAQLAAGGSYTFTLLDANGAPLGEPRTLTLAEAPLSAEQAAAAGDTLFPRVASINPGNWAALVDGVEVSLTATLPTTGTYRLNAAAMSPPGGATVFRNNLTSNTISFGNWVGASPTSPVGFSVTARNALGSDFYTFHELRQ
jgi:hypothetical protein